MPAAALPKKRPAFAEKSSFMTTLKFWSVFDPPRSDPRFADLLHRVCLTR